MNAKPEQSACGAGLEEQLPAGVWNAHFFGLLNNLSFQIVLGAPMVLFAKGLGASATVLGVITALTPLLTSLQLPAAKYLPRYGYRRFTLAGWTARTVAILVMSAIPLGAYVGIEKWWLLGGLLVALVWFNTVRGFVSGAWLPWISELIPERVRGRFLSRDQVFGNIGGLLSFSVAAMMMSGEIVSPWQFSLVFLLSAAAGMVSLYFCARIPESTTPERMKHSGHPVPWREMLVWPPFLRLLVFNLGWVAVVGGLGTFTVSFLRGVAGYADGHVVWMSAVTILGSLLTVGFSGKVVDRVGSGPVLRGCLGVLGLVILGWLGVSGGVVGCAFQTVAALNFLTGVATVNFFVANNRLVMGTLPVMGRNHFAAMYSVITSLGLGLSPIVWGVMLDWIGPWKGSGLGMEWNRYSVYFAAVGCMVAMTGGMSWLLVESRRGGSLTAATTEQQGGKGQQ